VRGADHRRVLQSGMVEDFIARKHGRAPIEYPHPAFEPILRSTYGVIVYQEQIMRIVNQIAGMSMAEALTMIRAISKKKESVINRAAEAFVEGAVRNGLSREAATEIFGLISHFAGYGFNKAHTSAYALIAYRTAYLKAHYPTEFMAASISCEMGDTAKVVELMEDCARLGIQVLPPDVNHSQVDFAVVGDSVIRFGLGAVKNVGAKAAGSIVAERAARGPFKSIFDFCERLDPQEVSKGAVEALLKAGCFDDLPGTRAQQLAALETAMKAGARARRDRAVGQRSLFSAALSEEDPLRHAEMNLPRVPPLSPRELAAQEFEALGLYVRHDPLQEHRAALRWLTTADSALIRALPSGDQVVLGGIVEAVRRRRTRDNRRMAVVRVLDLKGNAECVLWPEVYERHAALLESDQVLLFRGSVSHRQGPAVQVDEVIPLQEAVRKRLEAVLIRVECEQAAADLWPQLRRLIERNRGQMPVYLEMESQGLVLRCQMGSGLRAAGSPELARDIEELLGAGTVRLCIGGNGQRPRRRDWARGGNS